MPYQLRQAETVAYFDVTGEPAMDSYLGPDAVMIPYEAQAVIVGDRLAVIHVYGWIVGATGDATTKPTQVTFTRLDLGLDEPTPQDLEYRGEEDWAPVVVPGWVATIAAAATLARQL